MMYYLTFIFSLVFHYVDYNVIKKERIKGSPPAKGELSLMHTNS